MLIDVGMSPVSTNLQQLAFRIRQLISQIVITFSIYHIKIHIKYTYGLLVDRRKWIYIWGGKDTYHFIDR